MLIGPHWRECQVNWIKTPDTYGDDTRTYTIENGKNHSVVLKPGDGMVYKGCERPHWRDSMPGSQWGNNYYPSNIFSLCASRWTNVNLSMK